MGSEVGTVLDGQTFDFFPPRDRWVEPVPTRSREIENSPQLEYTPAPGFEPGSPDWEAGMLSTTPPRAPLFNHVNLPEPYLFLTSGTRGRCSAQSHPYARLMGI